MAKQYDVYDHIRVVSAAAESYRGLIAGIGVTVLGGGEKLKQGWATRLRPERYLIKGLMGVFCMIDLGQAFPADPELLDDSMRHLAEADAAFADGDSELRGEFEDIYRQFDEGAGPFYREYAHALGGHASTQTISETNAMIDPIVQSGIEMLADRESYTLIFPKLAETLAINRDANLA